ncbi:MAG: hypothetical protein GC186_06595 [Rhodobacteraceae bacterium]|nr:hypothetical protein [Paracoccaceae bacterium]
MAGAVWALYALARDAAPHGFLARRHPQEFVALLEGAVPGVAVGAFAGNRLVGYSISRQMDGASPLGQAFGFAPGTAYEGMGSAIHPEVAGRLLMARMLSLRGRIEQSRGGAHVVGLIDIANLGSVANVLRAGGALVGTRRDETSLNYVAYAGALLRGAVKGSGLQPVPVSDLAGQRALFEAGWAATGLRRDGGTRCLTFQGFPTVFGCLGLTDAEASQ